MVDKLTRIGTGGRLYRDARPAPNGDSVQEEPAEETPAPQPVRDYENPAPPAPPWSVKPMHEPPAPPKPKRDWREFNSTALEVIGVGVLSAGFSMLYLWLGIVVLGACLIVLGYAASEPPEVK